MTAEGFVISAEHGLMIPVAVVNKWRERFGAISDLEAKMAKLATYILKGGIMHAGWTSPEGWMVGPLSDDNQRALREDKVAGARIAKFSNKPKLSRY